MYNKIVYYVDKIERINRGEIVYPISVEIDPSNRCQCDCTFCLYKTYRKENNIDLDYSKYLDLLKVLSANGTKSITFTGGGEPLLHPRFNDMLEQAISFGFDVGLITNGIRLDEIPKEFIGEFSFIRVSLDSATPESYLNVKRFPGFKLVIHNIKETSVLIHENKYKTTLGVSCVVTDSNKDELDQLYNVIGDFVNYVQIKPEINDINNKYLVESKSKIVLTDRYLPDSLLPCRIAGLVGIVGADGNWYYCCQTRGDENYICGNIYTDNIDDIIRNRMNIIPDYKECLPCRYMNYAKAYDQIIKDNMYFYAHRMFL